MERLIQVGLGECRIATNPEAVLACYGLGSCVGVALYCPVSRVGALAHVMLPTSALAQPPFRKAKYADSAIPEMLEQIERLGGQRRLVVAKIAGGARMFVSPELKRRDSEAGVRLMVGERNVAAVKNALARHKIILVGEDTGGDYGRTMRFILVDGSVEVSSIRHGVKKL